MLEAIEDTLHQWFSKCSSLTSSISITRELFKNVHSWGPYPGNMESEILEWGPTISLNKLSR